jgi:DUF971 family protein
MKIESNATNNQNQPRPTEILLHQTSNILELAFDDAMNVPRIRLSAEYLRIHSPSAEVQGHSAAERILVAGKQSIGITAIHPVGNYAILLEFSDGHRTGIFSFGYLQQLANEHATRWPGYLAELSAAGLSR